MTKKKPDSREQPDPPKKAGRQGTSMSVYLPPGLKEALDRYVDHSRPKTTLTAVVQTALEDFLTKEGLWPPAKED